MKATDKLKKVKVLLGIEVKLEQMKLEDGAVLEAESFEAGKEVFIIAEEDKVALPVGEYEIEGGKVLVVSEEGLIGEIKEAEAKEEPKEEEAVEEVEAAEEPKEDEPKEEPKKEYATKEEVAELKALVEKLMSEKEELSTEEVEETVEEEVKTELSEEPKEEVEEEVKEVELSKEEEVEEAKPFKHNPEVNLSSNNNLFSNRDKKLGNIYRIINGK